MIGQVCVGVCVCVCYDVTNPYERFFVDRSAVTVIVVVVAYGAYLCVGLSKCVYG